MRGFLCIIFFLLCALPAGAKSGRREVTPRLIHLKLKSLGYGQPDAGHKEIEIKLNHFLKDFDLSLAQFLKLRHQDPANEQVQNVLSSVHYDRFLSKRNIQVVRDPLGKFQIFDGHHLAQSLRLLEVEDIDVELHEDFWIPEGARSRRTLKSRIDNYRTYMIENSLVRLVNRRGRKIDFDDLQDGKTALQNNPFRSLAWILKKSSVYEDLDTPLQEFVWSDFLQKEFRKRHWLEDFHTDKAFLKAAHRALTVLSSTSPDILAKLPGYIELPKKVKKLRDKKEEILDRCERLLSSYEI